VTKPLRHDAIMPSISGGRSCSNGKRRKQKKIGGRWLASPRHCRASFHRLFYLARSAAHSCRRRHGSRSIRIGAHIHFALIASRVRLLPAPKRQAAGAGGLATTARSRCHLHSGRRPRLIGNAPTSGARAFAVCAGNRFIASAGMSICGKQGPTRMRSGTARVWSHGNSGMRRVITRDFCGACKRGAAMKAADGCGRAPKLIIASRVSGLERTSGCALAQAAWLLGLTKPSGDQSRRSRRKMRNRSARSPRRALSCVRTPLIA
jgi:hypothetical protein